jgi:hypothetical protein
LSDDKRKTTATHLSQKALKLANTAVAADTNGNVKAALAEYKSAVHYLGLALHVQRDSNLVDTGELQEFHRAYSERIEQLEAKLKGGGSSKARAPLPDAAADKQPSAPRRMLGSLFATRSSAAAATPIAHDLARVRESMACGGGSSVPGASCGGGSRVAGASHDGARRGRLSHAEAGRGFFVALQAAQEHLLKTVAAAREADGKASYTPLGSRQPPLRETMKAAKGVRLVPDHVLVAELLGNPRPPTTAPSPNRKPVSFETKTKSAPELVAASLSGS